MAPLELRTRNRYELHPQNKRQCNTCLTVYDGIEEHFHVKRIIAGKKSFEPSCKECRRKHLREAKRKYRLDAGHFISQRIAGFRHRAQLQGVPFNLDAEYLIDQWHKQAGHCFYTTDEICFTNVSETQKHPHPLQPSLDRLDPDKGYVKGNVVWCSHRINTMKGNFTYEQFIKMCSHIADVRKRYDDT